MLVTCSFEGSTAKWSCGQSSPSTPRGPGAQTPSPTPPSLTEDVPSWESPAITEVRRKDEPFAPTWTWLRRTQVHAACCSRSTGTRRGSWRPKLCSPRFLTPSGQDHLPPRPSSPAPMRAAPGCCVCRALSPKPSARLQAGTVCWPR